MRTVFICFENIFCFIANTSAERLKVLSGRSYERTCFLRKAVSKGGSGGVCSLWFCGHCTSSR